MSQIIKYLLFVVLLVATYFTAANYDLISFESKGVGGEKGIKGIKGIKGAAGKKNLKVPYISKKPSSTLNGFSGQVAIDYSPIYNLTAEAAGSVIMVWKLPDSTPMHEIDSGEGFKALSLRFIPATSLIVVSGMNLDFTGSIRFFDAATGRQRFQIDEPEPILFLDPHPAGRYLLATAETYIKVLDMKDGNTVAIIQKNNPTARGYYYANGQYVLQSDTLSLFDLKKRSTAGTLDAVTPLIVKKGLDGKTVSWLSASGVTVVTASQGEKKFYPLDTKGVTAFDIESTGIWGIFLLDTQQVAVVDLAAGKKIKTIELASPVSEVAISSDGSSAYLLYPSGSVAVYDIGYRNTIKSMQVGMIKLFSRMKSKIVQPSPSEPN